MSEVQGQICGRPIRGPFLGIVLRGTISTTQPEFRLKKCNRKKETKKEDNKIELSKLLDS
jgi:hypothetical protein